MPSNNLSHVVSLNFHSPWINQESDSHKLYRVGLSTYNCFTVYFDEFHMGPFAVMKVKQALHDFLLVDNDNGEARSSALLTSRIPYGVCLELKHFLERQRFCAGLDATLMHNCSQSFCRTCKSSEKHTTHIRVFFILSYQDFYNKIIPSSLIKNLRCFHCFDFLFVLGCKLRASLLSAKERSLCETECHKNDDKVYITFRDWTHKLEHCFKEPPSLAHCHVSANTTSLLSCKRDFCHGCCKTFSASKDVYNWNHDMAFES